MHASRPRSVPPTEPPAPSAVTLRAFSNRCPPSPKTVSPASRRGWLFDAAAQRAPSRRHSCAPCTAAKNWCCAVGLFRRFAMRRSFGKGASPRRSGGAGPFRCRQGRIRHNSAALRPKGTYSRSPLTSAPRPGSSLYDFPLESLVSQRGRQETTRCVVERRCTWKTVGEASAIRAWRRQPSV